MGKDFYCAVAPPESADKDVLWPGRLRFVRACSALPLARTLRALVNNSTKTGDSATADEKSETGQGGQARPWCGQGRCV